MKNRASALVKEVLSAVVTMLKAKSMAAKNKANAMKTRLMIFWLLRNKKFLVSAVSQKIHALLSREKGYAGGNEHSNKMVMSGNTAKSEELPKPTSTRLEESAEECREIEHLPFNLEDKNDELGYSSNFNLEDDINHMADDFIKRFRRQIRMEKQDSFKMYQEMQDRGT